MNPAEPTCLVTGAAGFMGSQMVELLLSRGCRVIATDLPRTLPSSLPEGIEYVPADLTDFASMRRACRGTDVIFNTASIFDFSTPWEDMKAVNVDGAHNLCRAASLQGASRIVHWSTMMIFGEVLERDEPIVEDTPRLSRSVYARSKILQEDIVLGYSRTGDLPAIIIRPSIVYGPGSRYGLADMCFKVKRLGFTPAFTRLCQRACLVHSRDVVGAAFYLSSREESLGECYNVTDDTSLPMKDLCTVIAVALGLSTVPLPLSSRTLKVLAGLLAGLCSRSSRLAIDGRPAIERDFVHLLNMDGYASNAKLRATGYELQYPDWRTGLIEVSKWYRERGLW